jgi:hypothetical protein
MARCAILILLVAACGDDGGRARPDANPDDLDSDGVLNAQDNCPNRTNADQHDEDHDAVGDACDNCPTIANANQADTTEAAMNGQFPDGVGNACDLRPGLGGDEIARVSTFATTNDANKFNGSGWTIDADAASSMGNAQWQSKSGELGDGAILVAEISALVFTAGGELTIAVDGNGIESGAACTLRESGEFLARDLAGGATAMTTAPALTAPLTITAWRSIVNQSATVMCRLAIGGMSATTEAPLTDTTVVGNQALVATGATSSVTSLVLYTSPGPKSP